MPERIARVVGVELIGFLDVSGSPSVCDGVVPRPCPHIIRPGRYACEDTRREGVGVLQNAAEGGAGLRGESTLRGFADGLVSWAAPGGGNGRYEQGEDERRGQVSGSWASSSESLLPIASPAPEEP